MRINPHRFLIIPLSRRARRPFQPRTSMLLSCPQAHNDVLTILPLRFRSSFEACYKADRSEEHTPWRMQLNGLCLVYTTMGLSRSDPSVFTSGGTLFSAEPLKPSKNDAHIFSRFDKSVNNYFCGTAGVRSPQIVSHCFRILLFSCNEGAGEQHDKGDIPRAMRSGSKG
jgi:hypothetical protein